MSQPKPITRTSGSITFIDKVDSRKLNTYITSNLPTIQIFDQNTDTYSPNWSSTNLVLTASIYLDSKEVTEDPKTNIVWLIKNEAGEELPITSSEGSQIPRGASLIINNNDVLSNASGIITYVCMADYEGTISRQEISFTRIYTGLNGDDGRSVTIKGTATSVHPVSNTDYYTITYDSLSITAAQEGDGYLYNGDLYVCVGSQDGADYFVNVGNIQGPKGDQGESAKAVVLNASAQIFRVDQTDTISPRDIAVTAYTFNTTVNSWTYSVDGGKTFLSTAPIGVSLTDNTVNIKGSSLTTNSLVIKASDGTYSDTITIYKVFDGEKGDTGTPAPIAFLTNENITFGANEKGQIKTTSFTTNVVAYSGITKVTPTIGDIVDLPTGMTLNASDIIGNELMLTFAIDNNSTLGSELNNHGMINIPITSPVKTNLILSWSKVNSGAKGDTGIGINSVTVTYGVSDSALTEPTSWESSIPVVDEGYYLWTRTVTDYTDDAIEDTVVLTYAKQGTKGDTGSTGSSVTVSSVQYQSGTSATTAPTGTWSNNVVSVANGNYLWTKTAFSDGKVAYGVARQGANGAKGDTGASAVSFQIYAPNGYILTKDLSEITLQTFAYEGSTAITSGATYQWSQFVDGAWTNISGATSASYIITRADVLKSKSYRCIMTYKSQTYTSTVTVQDKTDVYNSIMCISSNATNNDCYWVLYTLVYSDTEEVDPLLGPIAVSTPTSPVNGDYWYAVDTANHTVTLKKYNGTSWVNSTDTQSLSYYWDIIDNDSKQVPLGASSKVKIISCHDFTATATLVCEVSNVEDGLLTQSSLSITDASDPIVSEIEPTATVNGQIWIKPNGNGTYLMFVWDASLNTWTSSDMDTRNKVYTSRPTSYNVGDLWITASDTDHGTYLHGTLLQAQKSNTTYSAADWSPTLRYDQDIDNMKETLNNLSQYVTITSAGLRIGARSASGELSPFTSLFTSTELSFYQNSEKLLTLANNQLTAPRIVVEDDLEVQGSIGLGDLRMIIESNGSFSFAVSK